MMKKSIVSLVLSLTLCLYLSVSASAYEMSKPGQVPTISSGQCGHTGIVDSNGTLWMCGRNFHGEVLGVELKGEADHFIKVMEGVRTVSCGDSFTGAVKMDGSLWMWGNNYEGALTGDVQEYVLTPKKIMDDVVSVGCALDSTAALKSDGSLWTWGNNRDGQLGNGSTDNSTTPIRVMEDVAAVSIGGSQSAAIKTDGSLWIWGKVYEGTNWYNQPIPTKIMDNVTAVSCGYWNTAAIKADGSLWILGMNNAGQLANGELHGFKGVPKMGKVMDNVAAVSCGSSHITAVTSDGSLWTWGENNQGQLGNGHKGSHSFDDGAVVQLKPAVALKNVAFVACGARSTFIVKPDGSIWGCGESESIGGSSNGTSIYGSPMQTVPVQIPGLTAKMFSPAAIASKVGGFGDVWETDYYADPVLWAVENGIAAGTSKTAFSPSTACSRAQVLTFLWRSQGEPEPGIENPFSDVSGKNYYYKAALWAYEKGLIGGAAFHGDTPCTRRDAVSYLWKLAGSPSVPPAGFTDVPDTADYAQAVAWAVEEGITSGTSKVEFLPSNVCTRGQVVTFLYRTYGK